MLQCWPPLAQIHQKENRWIIRLPPNLNASLYTRELLVHGAQRVRYVAMTPRYPLTAIHALNQWALENPDAEKYPYWIVQWPLCSGRQGRVEEAGGPPLMGLARDKAADIGEMLDFFWHSEIRKAETDWRKASYLSFWWTIPALLYFIAMHNLMDRYDSHHFIGCEPCLPLRFAKYNQSLD